MSNYINNCEQVPNCRYEFRKEIIPEQQKYHNFSKRDTQMEAIKNKKFEESNHMIGHSSQNFALRLSDDSIIDDDQTDNDNAPKIAEDEEIIRISDSSIDSKDEYPDINRGTINVRNGSSKSATKMKNTFLISSDSDNTPIKSDKRGKLINKNIVKQNLVYKKPTFYSGSSNSSLSSDSSSSNSEINNSNKVIDSSSSTHVSRTPELLNSRLQKVIQNTKIKSTSNSPINCTPRKKVSVRNNSNVGNRSDGNSFELPVLENYKENSRTPSSLNKLTKENTLNILKNTESTRAIYQSPKEKKREDLVVDETIDKKIHPALLPPKSLMTSNNELSTNFINETISDSENRDTECLQIDLFKSHELNKEQPPYRTLSEKKKKEISEWLMANSVDCQNDSSLSYVPCSSKIDLSSGNSSLERLEMNFETPNNRGRILKSKVDDTNSKFVIATPNRKNDNTVTPKNTMDKKVENTKNDSVLPVKSVNNIVSRKKPTILQTQSVDILGCADLLDKLYGNTWRDKADVILHTPVDKIQNRTTKDRAVQTERKLPKNIRLSPGMSGGRNKTRNITVKSTKSHISSKKNLNVRSKNQNNSFINDWSSSDSENETYYTALTHPRTSTDTFQSHKPLTTTGSIRKFPKRIFSTPESDSETADSKSVKDNADNVNKGLNRRKLLFSDDEHTSEFDPDDEVPDKRTYKKNSSKPAEKGIKEKSKDIHCFGKHQSFLASLSNAVPISNAHPDAKRFRLAFKTKKEELCNYLYKLYNEKVFDNQLPKDMKIEWNIRMRGTAGYCYNKRSLKPLGGIARSSRIVLATKILDTPDRLRDTLIHEMCHAAAWLINDVSDGHGPFWTAWVNKAMKVFPELPPIRRCHDYKINTKFTYRCMSCGYSVGRHSKSLDVEKKRCGYCYGKFELLVNKTTKSGTVQIQTPKREPSAFALFVKDNYNSVKKERNAKHGEVMKILSQQFSAIKIVQRHDDNIEINEEIPD